MFTIEQGIRKWQKKYIKARFYSSVVIIIPYSILSILLICLIFLKFQFSVSMSNNHCCFNKNNMQKLCNEPKIFFKHKKSIIYFIILCFY
ncbi:hypothetical protein BpHYR1_048703 [Brachionus plicatilis]|uniref:Uncharacterized protein n=1 Tax=Brachionus plicatilis TaxID=10195 RepID=A0A3M7S4N4_BRAPC|nr:hypothetical protein BpHYR1_048703 [Brachionus plicatilis]